MLRLGIRGDAVAKDSAPAARTAESSGVGDVRRRVPAKTRDMASTRTTTVLIALSSAVFLAGCSDSTTSSDSGSGATQAPNETAAVAWAGGVCAASTELREQVRTGQAQLDPASSSTSLDQVRTQVRDRVTAVRQSAAALGTALSALPTGADPQVTAARQQLQTDVGRVKAAVDQLGSAADEVAAADSTTEVATGLMTLKAALAGTANDLATYLESLRGTIASAEQAIRDAFGAAPACQDLAARATPTASP